MKQVVLALALVTACESDKPAKPQVSKPGIAATPPIVGTTGPAELLPADGAPMSPFTIAEYQRELASRSSVVVAKTFPDGLSKLAGAGVNMSAGAQNVSWVIDGDPDRGFWFAYDENANGDLRDDVRRDLKQVDGAWELTVVMKAEGMFSGELVDAPARIRFRVKQGEMRIQRAIARHGTLTLPAGPMKFALIGDSGQFGLDHHFLAFDLDRDGKLDLETLDNPELFHVFEKHVTLDDKSYSFSLDLAGAKLTLQALPKRLPNRPPLTVGSVAPDFSVTDFDGKPATLASLRGKVVLIDFWATACAPCVKALPRLAELRMQHHTTGFELMSVAMDTEDVRTVLGAHRTGIAAISDAAQATYRVDRYPMYFLIARDGTIACSRCQLDKIEAMLAAQLGKQ